MSEELQQALKILAIIFIFGVVAYSILFFDDDHAEF